MAASVVLVPECGGGTGFGHLERMLALADALPSSLDVVVVTVDEDVVVERVTRRGHMPMPLEGNASTRALRAVSMHVPQLAVLDGYGFTPSTQTAIRQACRLVVVDDLDGPCACDLAVNPAPGAQESAAPAGAAVALRGPAYALLAAAYLEAREHRIHHAPEMESILVSGGGADAAGITLPLVKALLECSPTLRLDLVRGPGTGAATGHPRVTVHRSPMTLGPLLTTSMLYAGAAGTTAVQAACSGVPAIIAAVADNQVNQARVLQRAGCAELIDMPIDQPKVTGIAAAVLADCERRDAMSRAGRALIDGHGSERVAAAIVQLLRTRTPA